MLMSNGSAPAACGLALDFRRTRGNGVERCQSKTQIRIRYDGLVLQIPTRRAPGAGRPRFGEFGFATKREAEDAERKRRTEEQQKYELAKLGAGVDNPLPKTLAMLLEEFFQQHANEKLAPKTIERYHEQAACLDHVLLNMPIADITPLHLSREWKRLLESGGHQRRTKTPRPLSAKTVRNIAGVVSSAFARAVRWGLVTNNPVTRSEPPVPKKRRGIALTPAQQALVCESASGVWCLPTFLEISAATGARRGEISGASLVGHPGRPRSDRAIAHANQTGPRVQGSEDRGQRSCGEPPGIGPSCPRYNIASGSRSSGSSSVQTTGPIWI